VGTQPFVDRVIDSLRVAPLSTRRLAARIDLPSRTIAAGSTLDGHVIVVNNTGAPRTYSGCGGLFGVALANDTIDNQSAQPSCLMQIVLPEGETSYPVGVSASSSGCTNSQPASGLVSCLPGGVLPPLPVGKYDATLNQYGSDVPPPAPVPVRVVGP
jgi:hypothetical protein